ncbi:hypothetical protein [Catenulispora pinisilvae]|uniref:hypothetical protein n=1 Tax=Catenulispora pinisilvae TaxID=2705253 RepID=UPI002B26EC7A|nr:hypothetical protein [Catenulispora pinisilvae]
MRHHPPRPLRSRLLAVVSAVGLMFLGTAAIGTPASAATSITNSGFETGNLSGWTATGVTSVTTTNPHSGTYAAMVGSTSPSNTSSIAQSFTAPASSPSLSFWYDVVCPDTVQYDWATATLKDTTTNTTTTVLPKTCVNPSSGWKQVTKTLTANHNYTLTLTSKDDNYPGDPTYTLYDDVTLSGGVPANDFSISDSPASAAVNPGASATSTISTAVTSGSAQSVTLSASGLPSGASATFSTNPVTAGGSSTMTVATASSTPPGSYPITVTGTGASATHATTFTLTVNGSGGPTLQKVSTDPYTDTDAQHATEVEPDTFAYGNTVVAAYQVGRVNGGGSSNLGWATSTDGGTTWTNGFLPGITVNQGGTYSQVSDASVAYDVKHNTWMVAGLPIDSSGNAAGVLVNRSTNGGTTWTNPVNAVGFDGQGYDKQWIVCDDTSTSPYYGNCYIEADNTSQGNAELMSTSTDGGQTWGAAENPSGGPSGLGGQPLVQPNGTVVVPFSTNGSAIEAFTSANGGASWGNVNTIAQVQVHTANGSLRDGSGLPSAEIDATGKVYVAWQDCRFRSGCPGNDIVMSTSTNGTTWSAVTRIPIDAVTSGTDHFIPGLGVDHATSGATAKLGLYYYAYSNANCTTATCQMSVGYISSADGGSTWSSAQTVAGPMTMAQIANTSQGYMVGDYISCSVVNGKGVALFAVGKTPTNGQAFDEGMWTVGGGLAMRGGPIRATTGPVYATPQHPRTPALGALR